MNSNVCTFVDLLVMLRAFRTWQLRLPWPILVGAHPAVSKSETVKALLRLLAAEGPGFRSASLAKSTSQKQLAARCSMVPTTELWTKVWITPPDTEYCRVLNSG